MRVSTLIPILLIAVSLGGAFHALGQADPPRYRVTDLGDLGGGESVATSINARGQIVGASWLAGHTPVGDRCDERRAFLYEDGVMGELASLPGTRFGTASAISDSGYVAGTNDVYVADASCPEGCFPGSCLVQTPVLIDSGLAVDLSAPLPWYDGVANDVNNARQVVGWSRRDDLPNPRTWHGYLWADGVRTDLGTLQDDWSIATGINDRGLVVGYSQLVEGSNLWYGFRWSGGVMTGLPTLDAANTVNGANDVNATGDAVGWSGRSFSESRPVLYPASGGVIDLGSLGGTESSAYAMNNRRSVVGYSYTMNDERRHAFLYRDGELWDLNELLVPDADWELIAATDVNDVGEIVGFGCNQSAAVPPATCVDDFGTQVFRRAFLLTPVTSLSDLEGLIESFDLPRGLENSLLAKIAAARRAYEAGRERTACNLLGSLRNEVEAQTGRGLTTEQADLILETLRLVEIELGCS